jgi:ABC-type uncharacterized transport system permease subunit
MVRKIDYIRLILFIALLVGFIATGVVLWLIDHSNIISFNLIIFGSLFFPWRISDTLSDMRKAAVKAEEVQAATAWQLETAEIH